MKAFLLSIFSLFLLGFGSLQTASAQDLQAMEKNLAAISDELNQKTKEFSWQLLSAYADYCEDNVKYISWNDFSSLQDIVEFERPASLESYRLASEARKKELNEFLNTYEEYKFLKKKQSEAVSKEAKDENSAAFSAFWKKLRDEKGNLYKDLYRAERKTVCKYRAEAVRYLIAQYKEKNQAVPTTFIKYQDRNYLLQRGSGLELLQKQISTLERVQQELVDKITRTKYGLKEDKE